MKKFLPIIIVVVIIVIVILGFGLRSCGNPATSTDVVTPTPAPTAEPTAAPTAEPTPAPTAEPTPAPTAEPTPAPTAEPTPAPTVEPTPAPTVEPTPAPAAEPTPAPAAESADGSANGGNAAAAETGAEKENGAAVSTGAENEGESAAAEPEELKPLTAELAGADKAPAAEIPVTGVKASSEYSEYAYLHGALQGVDHNIETDWRTDGAADGAGEWIELMLLEGISFDSIRIKAGYWKSEELFHHNGRPAGITIEFSNGESVEVTLPDGMEEAVISLSRPVSADSMRITIGSIYPGSKNEGFSVSEIAVYSHDGEYIADPLPVISVEGEPLSLRITAGYAADLKGTVRTVSGKLTDVTVNIVKDGMVIQTCSVNPNSSELDLYRSKLNNVLQFGKLDQGRYSLELYATAQTGTGEVTMQLLDRGFTVVSFAAGSA